MEMKRFLGNTCVRLSAVLVFGVGSLHAQSSAPSLTGIVTDQLGGVLLGARVTLVRTGSNEALDGVTDAQGRFALPAGPGTYLLRAEAPGFMTVERQIEVPEDTTAPLSISMLVAGQTEEVEVVVGRDYRAASAATATRIETLIHDVPQSVQVVTAQLIADQRPLILNDALQNVSGISGLRNSAEIFRTFNVRGFTTIDLSVDGLRNTYGLNDQPDAVATIDRIEVAKGPTAALYGRGSLGGTVNVVTKSPRAERRTDLSFSTGSGGLIQPTIDVGGALTPGGGLRARAIVDYEDRDTPIDFVSVRRWQIAPAVEFDIGATTVLMKTDFRSRRGRRFVALPAYGTVAGLDDLQLPFNLFIGEPAAGAAENTGWQTTVRGDHRVNSRWTVTTAARWTYNTFDMPSVGPNALQADRRTLTRRYSRFDEAEREVSLDAWVTGTIAAGPVTHTLVAGADWARFEYRFPVLLRSDRRHRHLATSLRPGDRGRFSP